MPMYQIEISVPPEKDNLNYVRESLLFSLKIKEEELLYYNIEKKSLDARKKSAIRWIYRINFKTKNPPGPDMLKLLKEIEETKNNYFPIKIKDKKRIVVVGMGPAGIFCGLFLAIHGLDVTIIEKGKSVEERIVDVEKFFHSGLLDENSNIQFGEGGAGTFSDGKLTARTRYEFHQFIIDELINAGAPDEIAYLNKPHIGTNLLRKILKNLRVRLISLGVNMSFQERFISPILSKDRTLLGIRTDKRELESDYLVLAVGNSARDVFEELARQRIILEPKGFAMGFRMELRQKLINRNQYGDKAKYLPPADFFLSKYFDSIKGSVYTFCMCPGGYVIPASSEKEMLVLNGMSNYERDNIFGNAGLVISLSPKDWNNEPFGGIMLQREVERKCFIAGGGGYQAPFCTTRDFVERKIRTEKAESSYPRGLTAFPLWEIYAHKYIYFKEALKDFDIKLKGVLSDETILLAPETRTSSPIRIRRDENHMVINAKNIFVCGEGAGYAGGIISSAADGVNTARIIINLSGR